MSLVMTLAMTLYSESREDMVAANIAANINPMIPAGRSSNAMDT